MRRFLAAALTALATAVFPVLGHAQVFGQYTPAETVPVNGHLLGAYLNASENFFGLLTQLRLSFYPDVDFGFQGGLTRIDFQGTDATTVRLGADFKYLAVRAAQGFPVDLAVGAGLGVETGDNISVLSLGPSLVVSRNLAIGSSAGVTPFFGLGLLFSNLDVLDHETTDFSVPFRVGSEFRMSQDLRLGVELQFRIKDDFNDDVSFVTGVNIPF
ncbi:MAG TPA: hypothetical protein VGK93_05400 [Candidatus Eisenbacteria bacterium]